MSLSSFLGGTLCLPILFFMTAPAFCGDLPPPPVAKKAPLEKIVHGDKLTDDYGWLREKGSPEVTAYLAAENHHTEATLQPTAALREKLYQEMVSRIKETDSDAPFKFGNFLYYTRTEKGKQYKIYCRKPAANPQAPEQVTLDLNQLAEGQKFLGLDVYEVSDDGNLLAYSTDNTGFRQYTLRVKDLRTGKLLPDQLEKVDFARWSADGKTLFYIVQDKAKRPYRLYRHALGEPADKDVLIHEEKDELYVLFLDLSADRKQLLFLSASSTTTEGRYLPRDNPAAAPALILPREEGHEYYPDSCDGRFFLRTNKEARNFRVVSAPFADPAPANWKEIVPHRPEVKIDDVDFFARFHRGGGTRAWSAPPPCPRWAGIQGLPPHRVARASL